MSPDGEADAIRAIDQANQLNTVSGFALALIGLALFLVLAVRSGTTPVPKLAIVGAAVLTMCGAFLSQCHTAV